jgi:hypothetical protein
LSKGGVMKRIMHVAVFTVVLLGLMACSSLQIATVKTKADFSKCWNACIDSLADVGFAASSTDKTSGLIIADQGVVGGHGKVVRLNIQIIEVAGEITVTVKFIPSPGLVGGSRTAERYANALKLRIPDAEISIVK